MHSLSSEDLRRWQQEGHQFLLIDVREDWEHEAYNIGGELMPLGRLMALSAGIPKDQPVVLYCEKGIRSVIAIQRLQGSGFENLYNLSGGMKAWRESMQQTKF